MNTCDRCGHPDWSGALIATTVIRPARAIQWVCPDVRACMRRRGAW